MVYEQKDQFALDGTSTADATNHGSYGESLRSVSGEGDMVEGAMRTYEGYGP